METYWRPTIINLNIINYTTSGECEKTGKTDKTGYKDHPCNTVLSILSVFPILSLSPYDLFVRILRGVRDKVLSMCRQRLEMKVNALGKKGHVTALYMQMPHAVFLR